MITTEDMAMIVAGHLEGFGMPMFMKGHIPVTDFIPDEGRITITPKEDSAGQIFDRCFIEVNFLLPDINQEAHYDLDRIERDAYSIFHDGVAGTYEDQWYRLSYSRRSREREEKQKAHYVHFQLLFEILNTL